MRMTPWLYIVILTILTTPNLANAMAHIGAYQACKLPESNYLSEIQQRLSLISINQDNTNVANIAYIISAAFNSEYKSSIDISYVSTILNKDDSNQRKISLLDIKRTLTAIGARVDAEQYTSLQEILNLTNKVIISKDHYNNYYAMIGSSPNYVYLVYGINNQRALICPVSKVEYVTSYTTNKFLILEN